MDGGSSINILYYETFQRLGLPDSRLENTKVTFHGIVPGHKAFPIGKVTLPVTFGTPVNYHTERITFEVVNFRSSYHYVLGRQAFARFMAAPHYAYNMMKIPGPRGIITVHGDPEMALECKDSSAKLADAVIADEHDNTAEHANLNHACPKDLFVLPRIDQIIDAVAWLESLCFLDAYSGYNQIKMAKEDQEKTTFITPLGAYYYTSMTFGLKNAGATYQRCMNSCLESQIGRNVHVYIDDVVVKSTRQDDLIADLTERFPNLRRYKIKLNPLKCTFGVPSGQLLGYVVSKRGIEPNPKRTLAVMRTKQPTCLVDAQKLAGRVATLSRFIPRLGDEATPLYRLLKKSESFESTEEAQRALEELQHAPRNAPVPAAPLPQETMLLYIAASNSAISAVMVVERKEEGKEQLIQRPVYYINEALIDSKQRLGDSDLVASQTSGTCDATDANMIAYKRAVDQAGASFAGHVVEWVDRHKKEEADALAKLGSKRLQPPPGVFLDILSHPSVRVPRELDIAEPPAPDSVLVALASDASDWTEPYLRYLERQVLPMDETEARALVRRCKSFTIINNELYKRSTSGVFQRCVGADEGRKILRDIHAGDCSHHAAHEDAVALVRACAGCQKYASQSHMPGSALKTIPLTWPFAVWGLDMVGKFKTAPGGYTHLLVAVDKFTKWVEAKPIKKCDGKTATKFLRELIYRYGYPHSIITDNGTNFAKGEMADFCEDKGIRLDLASVADPESNGQAERANQSILHGIKPRLMVPLERAAGCWAEELPSVLWGIHTTPNRSTGFTPFFLVYGAEAVMPTDIAYDSPRVTNYAEEENERARQDDIDLLDEARDLALSRTAIYQQGLRRYHSRRVRSRSFQDDKGEPLTREVERPWNINLLRQFYT
nr:uncharacterized protein LOC127333572 [Lolium perenne]